MKGLEARSSTSSSCSSRDRGRGGIDTSLRSVEAKEGRSIGRGRSQRGGSRGGIANSSGIERAKAGTASRGGSRSMKSSNREIGHSSTSYRRTTSGSEQHQHKEKL